MSKLELKGEGLFNLGNVSQESQKETESVSQSVSLTINRKKVSDYTIPMTYRLKASTIEKIRLQAKQADMYINEYLQAVLDLVLDNVEIK
jgi:hypothetical protein